MNCGNLLTASADRNPRRTAIVFEDQSISYEQLEPSNDSPSPREAFFACFKAVPVNVRMKAPEIAYVLQQSQAVL